MPTFFFWCTPGAAPCVFEISLQLPLLFRTGLNWSSMVLFQCGYGLVLFGLILHRGRPPQATLMIPQTMESRLRDSGVKRLKI